MKKTLALGFVMMIMMVFGIFGSNAAPVAAEECNTTPQVVTLFAGQTIDAGTVTVDNDADNLYVTFETTGDWWLQKTHLHAADALAGIPTTKSGNPKVGNFAYQTAHDPLVQSYTYTIAKNSLSLDENASIAIAAHAEVVKLDGDGNVVQSETGWGDGETFTDRGSWAMYFSYTWQDCTAGPEGPDTKTETAFARLNLVPYGTNADDDDQVTCFLNITDPTINRWGWTNGPLTEGFYTFELWAGAGQCDTTKGTLVGEVTLDYNDGTATVTFGTAGNDPDTGSPYEMVETHLYIGTEFLPMVEGSYTVAPGSYKSTAFGQIHDELLNVTSDTYTITGLSGEIYLVAHATVDGFPLPATP